MAQTVSISEHMRKLKQQHRIAFIPFLMSGDPNLATTSKAIQILDQLGADVIELGVPYSDPLADGPTIHAAATRALLEQHVTLDQVLSMVKDVTPLISAPIILFIYYNPITARGPEKLCQQAKAAGISGILVPDIPLEETGQIREAASSAGLELVLLTTPTTPKERMQAIAKASQGFVYLVSVTGVTGSRVSMESRVEGLISMLHEVTDKSVAVGFGISAPDAAQQVVSWGAEGVIVGSALVKALGEAPTPEAGLQAMQTLAQQLRDATNN
ncbi:hypothetical protein ABBQ32_008678 [Trebouxia sp. C0010 RCD-2024]